VAEPRQKPSKSRQDYQTPPEVLAAVRSLLRIDGFALDAAASPENAVAPRYYTAEQDGKAHPWTRDGWTWLNPPFGDMNAWVKKAFLESIQGKSSAVLVPAAVGSNWWRDWVDGRACVYFLNGRVTFVGCDAPFPKDCALLVYAPSYVPEYRVWRWRKQIAAVAA